MVSDSPTRAIATEAWSQLVLSIISNSPPSDMSRNYYYTYPERGFNYLGKQLKRLERYKYKLGTMNIQTRMRYNMPFVQAKERENQQGIEHIRDHARSIKRVLQENEDENRQGIEHIQYCLMSSKPSKVVQTIEDENQQGIEHIRESLRSSKHSEVVQENEYEYQQGIEHIRDCLRSTRHYEVVRVNKDENHQGIDHIQDSSIFLMNSEFVLANENENQRGINHVLDSPRLIKHFEVVQEDEDEDKNLHGIEYTQDCPRTSKVSKVVQTNQDGNQQEIEHIQDTSRLNMHSELEQANKHGKHIEHIRDSIKSTVSFKPAEFDDRELFKIFRQSAGSTELPEDVRQQRTNYKEARKMSTLFDELLELIENRDLLQEEKPTLPFQVLKVIKLLHHYGVDTIRRGVENELEDVNLKSNKIEEDMAIHYKKKGLEVMLRICSTETCQRTIYYIIGKAERHQVFFK